MIQMNKKSVFRLLAIRAGKWAEGLNQGDAPPDTRQHALQRPEDITTAGTARKGGKWLAGMALTAALLGVGGNIFAQSNSARNAGTATGFSTSFGLRDWSNASNAQETPSRTSYANANLDADETSETFRLSNFNFSSGGSSLPTNAVVVGIQVQLYKSRETTGGGGQGTISDNLISLRNVGSNTNPSPTSSNWTTTPGSGSAPSSTYGSSSQKWGITLTNANLVDSIRNSAFGLDVRARRDGGFGNREARIHGATITVYYTLPGSTIVLSTTSTSTDATTYGTVDADGKSISVSGTTLAGNITATVNDSRFQISLSSASGYGSSVSLVPTSGTLAATDVYIRTKDTVQVNTVSPIANAISFSQGDSVKYLAVGYTVNPKGVSITAKDASKCYDATITGGEVVPSADRYTVNGLVGLDAVANVELSSTGFASASTSGIHNIVPSDLELSVGSLSNYSVSYNNGTLTVTDQVKGRISGAANTNICNGSNASVNIDQLGGGVPSSGSPFTGVFSIVKDGTTDTVLHSFTITGSPFAVSVPAAKLPATSSTTKYIISWKSLDNMTGCSTSSSASLTGNVEIYVYQTPTVAATGTPAFSTICSGQTPTINVSNPNAVSGAVYDMTANYHGITGGLHAAGHLAHAFGTLTEGTLVNSGNTLDSVTYTFTAKREGTVLCSSTPLVVKYYIQPVVKFDSLTVSAASVCHNDLDATSFTINGLLPSTAHEITFDITGDDENLGQVATRTSNSSGQIIFSAEEFNGGDPNPGTYTFTLTGLKANGCSKAISALNAKTLTIKPTPTFAGVTVIGDGVVCHENLTSDTVKINGLLAGKAHTINFDITGDYSDLGQEATLTANADGVIAFTAANFNDGNPAPGTYNFTVNSVSVDGCTLDVSESEGNSQEITINPTPTFESLSATATSVCVNNLEETTMSLNGLLPNKSHTITFNVTGEDESGADQTVVLSSDEEGTITFDGTAFNGGTPAVGTYTLTITDLEVAGCQLAVTTNNAKTIEIKPTPTITGASFTSGASACLSDLDSLGINFTGLLPNSNDTILVLVSGEIDGVPLMGALPLPIPVVADASGNASFIVPSESMEEFAESFLTTFKYDLSVVGVNSNGCITMLEDTLKTSTTIYNQAKVEDLEVSVAAVCADNRDEATFTINGAFAADVDYTFNYTITKGATVISTDDYTFNLESESDEITFPASIFAGSSVVPGNYTLTINSATLNGCVVTYEGETKPSADLELTGTPVTSFVKNIDTIYVGAGCATTMPNYLTNLVIDKGLGCDSNFTVSQLAPNAPGSAVIGFGGDRNVVFKITKNIVDGGTIVLYDTFKVHIADTTRPTAIAHSTRTVYLNNAGTASLTAAAINNLSSDNCTDPAALNIKAARPSGSPASEVYFACADINAPVLVTLHVKDASGNLATATTTVTVLDTVRPVITGVLPNLTVNKGVLCTNELPDYTTALDGISYTDNCGTGEFTFTQSPAPGTIIAKSINSQVITITVKDQSDNSATTSFTITYEDKSAPVFAGVPSGDIVVSAESGACAAGVELPNITATDNCTESVMVITERNDGMEEGSEFNIGSTVITYTAIDAAGNADTGSYNVVVNATVAGPAIVLESPDFYVPMDGPLDMSNVIMLSTETASPCVATVNNWPTATLSETPCADLGLVATETWTIGEGTPVTSDYEFPIGETLVTYTASYTYNEETVSSNAYFTVIVSDNAAPVLTGIENKSFEVNAEGCNASIATTGMDVVYTGTCDEENVYISWTISGTELAGEGQISERESDILLSAGEYTVTYTVEDESGNEATTSFEIVVTNPLDAMIEGTATVVKNALSTSTVKFTGEGGLAPYTFTYDVYRNDTLMTENATIATLSGSDAVTTAQSNSIVGTFKYVLKSIVDTKGCEVVPDETHIFSHTATITVIEPTAADISMNVRIAPASLKSTGAPRAVSFRLTNIGGTATTTGVVSFVVTKPRADVSGVPTCTLTSTTTGWEVVPHINPSLWTVRSTGPVSIAGGNTLQEVKCNLTYTGPAKGSATVQAKLSNGAVGDSNNSNNSFTKTIIIN